MSVADTLPLSPSLSLSLPLLFSFLLPSSLLIRAARVLARRIEEHRRRSRNPQAIRGRAIPPGTAGLKRRFNTAV